MNKSTVFWSLLFIFSTVSADTDTHQYLNDGVVKQIDQYVVDINAAIKKQYRLDNPGIGSSLKWKGIDENGHLWFYSLSDRGLNFEFPALDTGEMVKVFDDPTFAPFISLIKVIPHQSATVEKIITLQASGLPTPRSGTSSKVEIPLTLRLDRVNPDVNGIDSEGIAVDAAGYFWVVDEYTPSLLKFSATGQRLEQIGPTNGLPALVRHRIANRGFESLAVMPTGNLMLALESVLDINGETKNTARFIRFIEFNPVTRKTRMFAYPYDKNTYPAPSNVKIGDIVAVDNSRLLVIEQGKAKDGKMRNAIKLIDILHATDLTGKTLANGKALEYGTEKDLKTVRFVSKKHIAEMRKYGWPHEKLEGIAYIDPTHIALINDNDFGYTLDYPTGAEQSHYSVDLKNKTLLYNGHPTHVNYQPTGVNTTLWIIELQHAL